PPDLATIVIFGTPCTGCRDPKTNSKQRGVRGITIGKSDETKGVRVYLLTTQSVIVTRHVANAETLNVAGNAALKRALEAETEAALVYLARSPYGYGRDSPIRATPLRWHTE
ncbi:TPA: hypothetical protein N0F65_000459, partial [Lagenidium giganteum]